MLIATIINIITLAMIMNMNYAYTCDGATLSDRLRGVDALRMAEERLKGPAWELSRGSSTGGVLVSVGLALTLASIAIFAAAMLTQDFTGKYRVYAQSSSTQMAAVEQVLSPIPQI